MQLGILQWILTIGILKVVWEPFVLGFTGLGTGQDWDRELGIEISGLHLLYLSNVPFSWGLFWETSCERSIEG